jgi:hypothetical protein
VQLIGTGYYFFTLSSSPFVTLSAVEGRYIVRTTLVRGIVHLPFDCAQGDKGG